MQRARRDAWGLQGLGDWGIGGLEDLRPANVLRITGQISCRMRVQSEAALPDGTRKHRSWCG